MSENKEYRTILSQLRQGEILKTFTQKDIISVKVAPWIHMIQWEIVKQGTGGKDGASVYLKVEQMRQLCAELESPAGQRKLAADADSPYPTAWQYATGENGSRRLSVGGGKKGVRIQVRVQKDGSWDNRLVAVTYDEVREMCFLFRLVMGLVPATRYYKYLADAFWDAAKERELKHKSSRPADDEVAASSSADGQEATEAPQPVAEPQPGKPKASTYKLTTASPVVQGEKGNFSVAVEAVADGGGKGEKFSLRIAPSVAQAAFGAKWDKLVQMAPDGVKLLVEAERYGADLVMTGLPKKGGGS